MKITNLTLTNFRSFKDTQSIDFAKLTLLFGPNSVGKSTILLAIFYLQQILKSGQCDPQRIYALGGKYVGGFKNLVHGRDLSKSITIKIGYDKEGAIGSTYGRVLAMLSDSESLDDSILLLQDQASGTETAALEFVISWSATRNKAFIEKYSVWLNGEIAGVMYSDAGLKNPLVETLNFAHPLLSTTDDGLTEEGFKSQLDCALSKQVPFGCKSQRSAGALPVLGETLETAFNHESSIVAAIINEALSEIFVSPLDNLLKMLDESVCIGPLRRIPDATYRPNQYVKQSDWYDGTACWDELHNIDFGRDLSVNDWLSEKHLNIGYQLAYSIKKSTDTFLLASNPVESADAFALKAALGDKISLSISRENLDINPNAAQGFIDDADCEKFASESSLSKLHLGKEQRKELSPILWDTTLGLPVTSADVGVGVSQVIPLIVAAHKVSNGLVACEQPELHIHPRVQVGVGDLLTQPAGIPPFLSNPQFLIETHSEHLILRVLKRVRQTADDELPEGFSPVKNTDVSILYLEPTKEGIVVRRINIDQEGEFTDRWPHGFFGERREELM